MERVDVLVSSLASQEGSTRATRDSLNLAFTNQRSSGKREAEERMRGRHRRRLNERGRSRDERSGPIPLSFFPCLCAPQQPTRQKEEADAMRSGRRGEPWNSRREGETRHSGEIRASRAKGNKNRGTRRARNGAWIFRFPASH